MKSPLRISGGTLYEAKMLKTRMNQPENAKPIVEYTKVVFLHLVLAFYIFIREERSSAVTYVLIMYVLMIIHALGNGNRVKAGKQHFVNVLRRFTNVLIPFAGASLFIYLFFRLLNGFSPNYPFIVIPLLTSGLTLIILGFICPFLFGVILLSLYKRG
jgi:hypothetical protein